MDEAAERPPEAPAAQPEPAPPADAAELLELLQRTRADYLNYQARAAAEREAAAERAVGDFAAQFLAALDAVASAWPAMEKAKDPAVVLEGLRLLEREVQRILACNEVHRMGEPGEPFDPARHEAVGFVEIDGAPEGVVAEVVRPGYRRKNRVLRPALVRVARSPQPAS